MKILDIRSFELKSAVHEVFEHVWKTLVSVDIETGKVAIRDSAAGITNRPKALYNLANLVSIRANDTCLR